MQTQQLALAEEALKEAVALAPEDAPLHFLLGQVYGREGAREQAAAEFARTSRLSGTRSTPDYLQQAPGRGRGRAPGVGKRSWPGYGRLVRNHVQRRWWRVHCSSRPARTTARLGRALNPPSAGWGEGGREAWGSWQLVQAIRSPLARLHWLAASCSTSPTLRLTGSAAGMTK